MQHLILRFAIPEHSFLENHISHLRDKPEQELNRLLSMVVDVDNLYITMNNEENPDAKKIYHYLFRVNTLFKVSQYK